MTQLIHGTAVHDTANTWHSSAWYNQYSEESRGQCSVPYVAVKLCPPEHNRSRIRPNTYVVKETHPAPYAHRVALIILAVRQNLIFDH